MQHLDAAGDTLPEDMQDPAADAAVYFFRQILCECGHEYECGAAGDKLPSRVPGVRSGVPLRGRAVFALRKC